MPASSFWTVSSLQKQKGGTDTAGKLTLFCQVLARPGQPLRAAQGQKAQTGMRVWVQPDLGLGVYHRLSSLFDTTYPKTLNNFFFFFFKTQYRCPVMGHYEVSSHAISFWSVLHTQYSTYRGESIANWGKFGGWNRKSSVASWKIKAKIYR